MFHMAEDVFPKDASFDALGRALAALVHTGSPAISGFADWALRHPGEMAFHSVRRLADLAGVNVNTVFRLSVALGFSGFDECRAAFQDALRQQGGLYGSRAARLAADDSGDLFGRLRLTALANVDSVLSDANTATIRQAGALLLGARRVQCIGVRSCFSLAHYLAYTGRMAFGNFARPLAEPGAISDVLTEVGPEDVVVLISFSLYSAEVIRAHEAALVRGARLIAITDTYASPIARDAELVFCIPMEGPQTLPSQTAGFTLVEALIAHMIAQSPVAKDRIAAFERQLVDLGSYASAPVLRGENDPARG